MKRFLLSYRFIAAMLMAVAGSLQSYAYNNVWVKAEAYPTGAGKVYVTNFNPLQDDEYQPDFQPVSEFKRSTDAAASTAFIDVQPAEDYLFAGIARDNGNGVYDEGDEQVRRREEDGYFTAVYDPKEYNEGSSTMSMAAAEEALASMENPTDYIFAVFTKGDVARVTPEQSAFFGNYWGTVVSSKLDNTAGEEVTFTAKPDAHFHFVKWTDDKGELVSTTNPLTVTVTGGKVYLCHFDKGDPEPNGITDVRYSTLNDQRYTDLQGRTAVIPRKGIYIRQGKKVVVR